MLKLRGVCITYSRTFFFFDFFLLKSIINRSFLSSLLLGFCFVRAEFCSLSGFWKDIIGSWPNAPPPLPSYHIYSINNQSKLIIKTIPCPMFLGTTCSINQSKPFLSVPCHRLEILLRPLQHSQPIYLRLKQSSLLLF